MTPIKLIAMSALGALLLNSTAFAQPDHAPAHGARDKGQPQQHESNRHGHSGMSGLIYRASTNVNYASYCADMMHREPKRYRQVFNVILSVANPCLPVSPSVLMAR
ncbi:hypothetical protein HORIV_31010 [Vreelandella olivaria]|uniref:Uncharacterized protein n=1 Tax=Vreelandella olivaria TaxID=390919 RepID=A0ABM7GJF5_9GAMM|nr:hypothetical protein HORIV_31010 [Halomonas olivaria]